MFKALFNVLFSVITAIVNIVLVPINALVSNLLPDFSEMVASFYHVLNNIIGTGFTYFFSILPPNCRSFIIVYLTFMISFYTVSISAHAMLKVYTIIKNMKVW